MAKKDIVSLMSLLIKVLMTACGLYLHELITTQRPYLQVPSHWGLTRLSVHSTINVSVYFYYIPLVCMPVLILELCSKFQSRAVWGLQLYSSFSRWSGPSGAPCNPVCIWRRAFPSIQKKKGCWNFDRTLESVDHSGKYWYRNKRYIFLSMDKGYLSIYLDRH